MSLFSGSLLPFWIIGAPLAWVMLDALFSRGPRRNEYAPAARSGAM
jgi:hypothetical protein